MTAPTCASSAASSGVREDRWKVWLRIRTTSISRLRRATRSGSKSKPHATRLPTCSRVPERSSKPRAVLTEQVAKPDVPPVYDVANHSLVLFDRGDEIVV